MVGEKTRTGRSAARWAASLSVSLKKIPNHIGLTLVLCLVPFLGVVVALAWMHTSALHVGRPSVVWLCGLALVGAAAPLARLVGLWRLLRREHTRFRLSLLVQSYVSVILVFASIYALIQMSGTETAFLGMSPLWSATGDTFEGHLRELLGLYADSLYLSVMTITTVGFGDIAPAARLARVAVSLEALFGIAFMGIALGQYYLFSTHSGSFRQSESAADELEP